VELVRKAKSAGVDASCETAPHYLTLCDMDLQEDGRFKMNPPLRSPADREALVEGILDGTVDMIATDHAPHSAEEKARGLKGSAFGIVGLETAFPVLYTRLVLPGVLSLDKLLDLLVYNPRKRFGIPLDEGDCSIWDLDAEYVVDPNEFLTKGRATPFAGMTKPWCSNPMWLKETSRTGRFFASSPASSTNPRATGATAFVLSVVSPGRGT
jgi:dihydroorotase